MNKTVQTRLASILALFASVACAAMVYLAFFFPKAVAVWREEGQSLTIAGRMAWELSMFCQSYGRVLLPLLGAGMGGCVLWAFLAARRRSKERQLALSKENDR